MAVGDRVERGLHAIGIEERMNLFNLFRSDDMGFIACKLRDAIDLLEPIDLFIRAGETQAAAAVPADGMAREFFELGIKLGAIHMHLGHIKRGVEMRALTRGMPCRAGGQLALLDEDDV